MMSTFYQMRNHRHRGLVIGSRAPVGSILLKTEAQFIEKLQSIECHQVSPLALLWSMNENQKRIVLLSKLVNSRSPELAVKFL